MPIAIGISNSIGLLFRADESQNTSTAALYVGGHAIATTPPVYAGLLYLSHLAPVIAAITLQAAWYCYRHLYRN
jgi:hypothetical protein